MSSTSFLLKQLAFPSPFPTPVSGSLSTESSGLGQDPGFLQGPLSQGYNSQKGALSPSALDAQGVAWSTFLSRLGFAPFLRSYR